MTAAQKISKRDASRILIGSRLQFNSAFIDMIARNQSLLSGTQWHINHVIEIKTESRTARLHGTNNSKCRLTNSK